MTVEHINSDKQQRVQ